MIFSNKKNIISSKIKQFQINFNPLKLIQFLNNSQVFDGKIANELNQFFRIQTRRSVKLYKQDRFIQDWNMQKGQDRVYREVNVEKLIDIYENRKKYLEIIIRQVKKKKMQIELQQSLRKLINIIENLKQKFIKCEQKRRKNEMEKNKQNIYNNYLENKLYKNSIIFNSSINPDSSLQKQQFKSIKKNISNYYLHIQNKQNHKNIPSQTAILDYSFQTIHNSSTNIFTPKNYKDFSKNITKRHQRHTANQTINQIHQINEKWNEQKNDGINIVNSKQINRLIYEQQKLNEQNDMNIINNNQEQDVKKWRKARQNTLIKNIRNQQMKKLNLKDEKKNEINIKNTNNNSINNKNNYVNNKFQPRNSKIIIKLKQSQKSSYHHSQHKKHIKKHNIFQNQTLNKHFHSFIPKYSIYRNSILSKNQTTDIKSPQQIIINKIYQKFQNFNQDQTTLTFKQLKGFLQQSYSQLNTISNFFNTNEIDYYKILCRQKYKQNPISANISYNDLIELIISFKSQIPYMQSSQMQKYLDTFFENNKKKPLTKQGKRQTLQFWKILESQMKRWKRQEKQYFDKLNSNKTDQLLQYDLSSKIQFEDIQDKNKITVENDS